MQTFQPVLELLRLKKKADIKEAFCDESSDGNIDLTKFHTSLTSQLNLILNKKDIRNLFYQIDPYCKGSISYKALINYMENYEDHRLITEEPFHATPTLYPGVRVQDNIFEWMVFPELPNSNVDVSGDYVSLSRSGLLSFWRRDMTKHFETTVAVSDDGANMTPMATGLVCLPKYKMVAVSTTAADIRFFNSCTYKFQHMFSIVWLPAVVVHMDCYNSEKLVCGDFRGCVFLLQMEPSFFARLRRRADHLEPQNIPFDELGKGRATDLHYEFTAKSHFTNVAKVKYIPSNRAIISCSVNTRRSLLIHQLERKKSKSFSSDGGISCFDFCEKLNCVATGCIDNSVKLWNPSVNLSFSENLTGHLNSVTHILIEEQRLTIISADRNKTIRIWDMLRPRCLQTIKFKEAEFPGRQVFASLFLDEQNDKLIITTSRIAVLNARRPNERPKAHSDSELLVYIAYNSVFDCLITVGNNSSVGIWDPESHSLIHEYKKAHVTLNKEGIRHVEDITAAAIDPSERRLVTAGRDRIIKVWNFHLGVCLQEFKTDFLVLAISFVGFTIYAAGSSGSISVFFDNDQDAIEDTEWETLHEQAIVSLDCYSSTILASASSDGQIIIWLRKNADAKLYLKDSAFQDDSDKDEMNYPAKSVIKSRRHCGINQILFLQTRAMDASVGNLVSCGADGRIRFWNVICANKVNNGRLVSKFRAVFRDCDGILSMASDSKNIYLLTGDTLGYIRVYDLEDYYSTYGSVPANSRKLKPRHFEQFPFLCLQQSIEQKYSQHSKFQPDGGAEFGNAPLLLNCFRAHTGPVLKISYSNERGFLVTAARKGSIRLWSVAGAFLGSLDIIGSANILCSRTPGTVHLPPDIRTVASPLTLHVLNGGRKPHWERAMKALKLCHLGHVSEPRTERTHFCWMQKKTKAVGKELSGEFTLVRDLEERLPHFSKSTGRKLRIHNLQYENVEGEIS